MKEEKIVLIIFIAAAGLYVFYLLPLIMKAILVLIVLMFWLMSKEPVSRGPSPKNRRRMDVEYVPPSRKWEEFKGLIKDIDVDLDKKGEK